MVRLLSDYLFIGSLLLLVITVLLFFVRGGGLSSSTDIHNPSGSITDLSMHQDRKGHLQKQNRLLVKLLTSCSFWLPLAGILVSWILPKL
ncbi:MULTISPECIES: hypothetical protein [Paenibacillus]|uniref:hypothetical protein n=1 Tax=Paenibacillus TaxID=44249 RepID=UPI0022B8D93F|nr:hypothetical protein [Paenibacillus caseinilyticus]MCZ8521940.1 hypothetical protein [Paenibacillus caseinilyticus]